MKKTNLQVLLISLLLVSGLSGKQINDKFSLEFSERFRFLSWDNAISLSDDVDAARAFTRHRTSLGGVYDPSDDFEFCLKFTNEFRHYFQPSTTEFDINEVFVDQFYARIKKPFDYPVEFTIGRQNIILGEGFVVMDGHPLDGSRGIYFNAVRADWTIKSGHKITAFYSYMDDYDHYLPLINDYEQILVERPEEGICLYYYGGFSRADLQAYYIRKNIDSTAAIPVEESINTIGARVKYPLLKSIDFVIEGAHQFGKRNDNDRSAWAGYSYLNFKPDWNKPNYFLPQAITVGGFLYGGDDPETDGWEGWEPLFGRWPKWSESFIYTQIQEDYVAYWTNLMSLFVTLNFKLDQNVNLKCDYHHLMAVHEGDSENSFPGGNGQHRGELFIGKLIYKFNNRWSGHILWEHFDPGDYYFDSANSYNWLRTELIFQI